MRQPYLILILVLIFVPVLSGPTIAQREKTPGGRIVVCMIQLEHADAEYLASVLEAVSFARGQSDALPTDKHPDYQGQGTGGKYALGSH